MYCEPQKSNLDSSKQPVKEGSASMTASSNWKSRLGGVVAALLLLPVPAYAAITSFSWGSVNAGSEPPFVTTVGKSFDSSTGIATLNLYLDPNASYTSASPEVWSITGTFNTVSGGSTSVSGKWTGLDNFAMIQPGSSNINVSVVLSNGNNMFGPSGGNNYYYGHQAPADGDPLLNLNATPVSNGDVVTIKFTIAPFTSYSVSSTPVTLTLQ